MQKIISNLMQFKDNKQKNYVEQFSSLKAGQKPEALIISCCDSRIIPDYFTNSNPGTLFTVRNIGNLVPPYKKDNCCLEDNSVAAAIEYGLLHLGIKNIIVCGHSECGAMKGILASMADQEEHQCCCCSHSHKNETKENKEAGLQQWLSYGEESLHKFQDGLLRNQNLPDYDQLSQINVLQQIEHLKTHPIVAEMVSKNELKLHAWWFDLTTAETFYFDNKINQFIIIDQDYLAK